jgi:membrane-associated phospholipid phosphatase
MDRLYVIDLAIFRAIHRGLFGTPEGSALAAIQYAGREGMVLLIVLATLLAPRARRVAVAVRLTASVLLASGVCEFLKRLVSAPRPASLIPQDLAPAFWSVAANADMVRHARSWPSGHTTAVFAFAAALLVLRAPRRAVAAAFVVAVLTALGRIVLGAHFPSDVLAGATLGSGIAWLLGRPLDALEARWESWRASRVPPLPVPVPVEASRNSG